MDLNELRMNIDAIDEQIVNLIEDRMSVAEKIAECKIESGKSVFDKEREAQKLNKVMDLASNREQRTCRRAF